MRFSLRLALVGFTLFALGAGLLLSEFRFTTTPSSSATSTDAPTTPGPASERNPESKRPTAPARLDETMVAWAGLFAPRDVAAGQ